MDASNIRNELIQTYHNKMKGLIPHQYRKKINDKVLVELDKAVSIMAVQRDFVMLAATTSMQISWLKSVKHLVTTLSTLSTLPDTSKMVKEAFSETSSGFQELFRLFAWLIDREKCIEEIGRELQLKKEAHISCAYSELFRDDIFCNSEIERMLLQHYDGELTIIPGTVASELIALQQQLLELCPDLCDAQLELEMSAYRFQFLADQTPFQMDAFRLSIIRVFKQFIDDIDDLTEMTRAQIMDWMRQACNERFV